MKRNDVAYANLRAEMGRKGLYIVDIANACDIKRDTLTRKLSKQSPLYLDEAFKIQQTCFPDYDLKYLFAENA